MNLLYVKIKSIGICSTETANDRKEWKTNWNTKHLNGNHMQAHKHVHTICNHNLIRNSFCIQLWSDISSTIPHNYVKSCSCPIILSHFKRYFEITQLLILDASASQNTYVHATTIIITDISMGAPRFSHGNGKLSRKVENSS